MSPTFEFGDHIVTGREVIDALDRVERYEEALRKVEAQLISNAGDEEPEDVPCVPYIRAVLGGEVA